MLWDWNSIDSVSKWSTGFFWAGIAFLILLALAEIASHVFSSRKDSLAAVREHHAAEAQRRADQETETRHSQEVADLTRRAEESKQHMARAREDAENARSEAAAATKRTAALEGKVAQRHLALTQRQALVAAIRPFAGEKISIAISMGDHESQVFAADFVSAFREAGWDAGANEGIGQAVYSGPVTYGPQVTMNAQEADAGRYPRGFEALVQTLIHLGLTSQGYKNIGVPSGAIELRVGPKAP